MFEISKSVMYALFEIMPDMNTKDVPFLRYIVPVKNRCASNIPLDRVERYVMVVDAKPYFGHVNSKQRQSCDM